MPLTNWPQRYGCIHIDITWRKLLSAYANQITNLDRKGLQVQVENLFGGSNESLACTSVRSALNLFLATMNFPKGSEIIFTAINIPDMGNIVEMYGIKVVPVDIDLETLAPKDELLELAITNKTVAILVAHIYGKWIEMDNIVDIAHRNGIFVLEDCAECFHGFKRKGHELSDLVFYSFGLIKYFTCLGGAIVSVKDNELLQNMRTKLESYPIQSQWLVFQKLLKYSVLTFLINSPTLRGIALPLCYKMNLPYKEFFISLLRGYPGQILPQLQYQPSAALLKNMLDVLSNVNETDFDISKMKGDFVGDNLPDNVFIPGKKSHIVNYWLFPIVVDNPYEVMKALEKEGIEAYQGATQLCTVYKTATNEANTQNILPSKELDTSNVLSTTPELATGVSQAFPSQSCYAGETLMADGAQQPFSAVNSLPSYIAAASFEEKVRKIGKPAVHLKKTTEDTLYPYNAEYLIDHVLYIPVHKNVPFWYLENICSAVNKVMKDRPGMQFRNGKKNIILQSKL